MSQNLNPAHNPDELEVAEGTKHEQLEGWIPKLASDAEIRDALEKAFDYRGDVTLTLKDGAKVEGYLFDRRSNAGTLDACTAWLYPKDRDEKVSVPYSQIARLEFSGKDTAHGKSFETWIRKYNEKKAAGEKNIGLHPDKLD